MSKKKTRRNPGKDYKNHEDKELKAFIASFLTIIGFIIALIVWRNDKYVMYYANHGLVLFLGQVILGFVSLIPFIGWFSFLLWILWFVLWVITWMNALSGKIKSTFIITDISKKINI